MGKLAMREGGGLVDMAIIWYMCKALGSCPLLSFSSLPRLPSCDWPKPYISCCKGHGNLWWFIILSFIKLLRQRWVYCSPNQLQFQFQFRSLAQCCRFWPLDVQVLILWSWVNGWALRVKTLQCPLHPHPNLPILSLNSPSHPSSLPIREVSRR